jgi:hypothetical protein
MNPLLNAALRYAELGYRVFPCAPGAKTPLTKHGFCDATTDPDVIEGWWRDHPSANVAIATERLVVIDVDGTANPWLANEPDRAHELAVAPLSLTPNGGRHYVFRAPSGKSYRGQAGKLAPRVDVRADGGYIVVPPSVLAGGKAYCWAEGMELDAPAEKLPEPPAWLVTALDQLATSSPTTAHVASGGNEANTIPSGQRNATLARLAGTMRRVGMAQAEIVAALHVTNKSRCVPPLSPAEVERIAESVARYEPDQISVAVVENHWEQMVAGRASADESVQEVRATSIADPGPLPEHLLRIPGFISEVMDHCLETAPYPNQAMAFCGALALQAFLAGRKICDPGDNRTSIYLLGLAYASVGKDWPRKVNAATLHEVGLSSCLGDRLASGEGLQDVLYSRPSMLFQTDEIDALLQMINKSRDAFHESLMATLLSVYSSSNSIFSMRPRAGKPDPGSIDQPNLVLWGTAIPNHFFAALSERMMTNGFFARLIVVDSGPRSEGKDSGKIRPPERVVEIAKWWADFQPGKGNLENWHPEPRVVEHTDAARKLLAESRRECEREYSAAERQGDPIGTTVWGRTDENSRRLALIYAASVNARQPCINESAVRWATTFAVHQTRRMLFLAHGRAAETPFQAECVRLIDKLRSAKDRQLPHSVALKRMKMDSKRFHELIETLRQRGDVRVNLESTTGRAGVVYELLTP